MTTKKIQEWAIAISVQLEQRAISVKAHQGITALIAQKVIIAQLQAVYLARLALKEAISNESYKSLSIIYIKNLEIILDQGHVLNATQEQQMTTMDQIHQVIVLHALLAITPLLKAKLIV